LVRRDDLLDAFRDSLPSRLPFDFSHGLGLDGLLLWTVADRYANIHHIPDDLAHSADPHAGEPNTRQQIGADKHDMMWWAYRNAFAHALVGSVRQAAELRVPRAALLVSCVPLRPTAIARHNFGLYRRLLPGSWFSIAPFAPAVRTLVARRLREPLDPTVPL
jgi:hypothetical protein